MIKNKIKIFVFSVSIFLLTFVNFSISGNSNLENSTAELTLKNLKVLAANAGGESYCDQRDESSCEIRIITESGVGITGFSKGWVVGYTN